jgi:hypothetical protein
MDKAAIDVAKALVLLSELTTFELRGEWRRLHRMPPPTKRRPRASASAWTFVLRPPLERPIACFCSAAFRPAFG